MQTEAHSGPEAPQGPVTPSDPAPLPAPGSAYHAGPEFLLNRELTWLNFNFRVLNEAEDDRVPLLERVKFLAIVSSNLDEFFMKRIGGLMQQVGAGVQRMTEDGRTPVQQIEESHALIRRLQQRKRRTFRALEPVLLKEGIEVLAWEELNEADQAYLREYYHENIYPLATPQSTDPAHPFPFVSNLSLNLLVTLRHPGDHHTFLARVKSPSGAGFRASCDCPIGVFSSRSRV